MERRERLNRSVAFKDLVPMYFVMANLFQARAR